ncbi:uncharacterized protein LOC134190216 [Corticium candelabrum]|uniref:uncharacterized protein LOC134190216 n=1 Tax=Corticium candelabrum TaxID=121492 RepID=UPI002E265373|nr:uncharacterized protein LOC134190216 [Corticium candelabrum]
MAYNSCMYIYIDFDRSDHLASSDCQKVRRQRPHNKLQRRSSALEMSTTLNDEQKKTYASATKLELMSSEVSENSSDKEPPSEGASTAGRSQLLIPPLLWRAIEATRCLSFWTESTPEGRLREERYQE